VTVTGDDPGGPEIGSQMTIAPGSGVSQTGRAWARFDDLTPGGAPSVFTGPKGILEARSPGEVLPVLRAVEQATAAGCWAAGYLAYEAATAIDSNLRTRTARVDEPLSELPLAWFGLFGAPATEEPLTFAADMDRDYRVSPWRLDIDLLAYHDQVERIRQLIELGETYQCNLTVPMRARIEGSTFALYRDLALAQRGAHNAFIDTGRYVVASASPELFFDWRDGRLTTSPMKGTAARGRWQEEDRIQAQALRRSPKERAENVMIVDLLRNDLGRVAERGTVEVPQLFNLERFETLWQLTSTVTARMRPHTGLVEIMRAMFPCGSVTGAPKVRTMALIADLENNRRGVYCGAIGVVAPPSAPFRARFSVAIRTAVVDRATGEAVYGVGGGITWDSNSIAEHDELVAKAAILHSRPEDFQLLETMAYRPSSGINNREGHLRRLAASAEYFGFTLDLDVVVAALNQELHSARDEARVRLTVDRQGRISIQLRPMPTCQGEPVRLAVDRDPVHSSDVWLYHKTTRRTTYETRAARHLDGDDVILINERGELTETTIANLAVQIEGRWWTPPMGSGCLPGVERGRLLTEGLLAERVVRLDELRRVQGWAVVSSLRGWRAACLGSAQFAGVAQPSTEGSRAPGPRPLAPA
jgi:para-aminobenzoate synthetase/4-amino-4-deoxychorismate lyase